MRVFDTEIPEIGELRKLTGRDEPTEPGLYYCRRPSGSDFVYLFLDHGTKYKVFNLDDLFHMREVFTYQCIQTRVVLTKINVNKFYIDL